MYATIGIAREDKQARDEQTARNFIGFGATCMFFCHTPRMMGAPQWADIGMWVQTVMLLLQEEGIAPAGAGPALHSERSHSLLWHCD